LKGNTEIFEMFYSLSPPLYSSTYDIEGML